MQPLQKIIPMNRENHFDVLHNSSASFFRSTFSGQNRWRKDKTHAPQQPFDKGCRGA
jgi:hypothetical protein